MKTKNLEVAIEKLIAKFEVVFQHTIEMAPNFLLALFLLVGFIIISKTTRKKGHKGLNKISENEKLNRLLSRFLGVVILAVGIFLALGILHLDKTVTSLLAGVGIIGLAFSFAFQHVAADLLSGIIISVKKSVNVGDLIETNGHFGNVVNVDLRTTRIINVEGQHVDIPNRLITDHALKDYSETGFRRIDITGKINFNENLTELKDIVENEMSKFDFVFEAKKPNMIYTELDYEKVNFILRVWINFTKNDGEFVNARSICIEKLNKIFKEKNITLLAKEVNLKNT